MNYTSLELIMGKSKKQIRSIGLIPKHNQPDAVQLAEKLIAFLLEQNRDVYLPTEFKFIAQRVTKNLSKKNSRARVKLHVVTRTALVSSVDLIVVLGGDGTLISVARLVGKGSRPKTPVLGINMGQLGFLTAVRREEAIETLRKILNTARLSISYRSILDVTLKRKGRIVYRGPVINDVVVSKGSIARIIGVEVVFNDQFVTTLRADGVIVSSPTGSTAYALAAGGPILEPSLPALLIAPICPHSLTHRPIVVADGATIKLRLSNTAGPVLLTLDGQDAVTLKEGDVVEVRRSKKEKLALVSSPTRDYFNLLREKFKFGMRA